MIFLSIKPVDVLFLRGNRLFGGAGEHGYAAMPPWPSVFTGAISSRILADSSLLPKVTVDWSRAEEILEEVTGPEFGCTFLGLKKGNEIFLPLPSDLLVFEDKDSADLFSLRLEPSSIPKELLSSNILPMVPVLKIKKRKKKVENYWLNLDGWQQYLSGQIPPLKCFISKSDLWSYDQRLGIGMDIDLRTAAEGKIYTSDAVCLKDNISFILGFSGENIPKSGLVRLGGDGRGASIEKESSSLLNELGIPQKDWPGFKMICISPGIFPSGWLPPGVEEIGEKEFIFSFRSIRARLMAAAISRYEVISGWDMARHLPKPAERVVPTGSVYWFSVIEGDTSDLHTLWKEGIYKAMPGIDKGLLARKREGFGRVWFGYWNPNKEGQ